MRSSTCFQKGHNLNEGRIRTPEVVARVRAAAFAREARIRKKVSVNGVIYPNITQAAKAVGVSPKSIANYIASTHDKHKDVFHV